MTAAELDQVRAIVAQTCAAQGVPLTVPGDVARAVAAMIAGGRRRRRSPARATADVPVAVLAGAGEGDGRAP